MPESNFAMLRLRRQTCLMIVLCLVFGIIYHLSQGTVDLTRIGFQDTSTSSETHKETSDASTHSPDANPLTPETVTKQPLYPVPAPRLTIIALWAPTNQRPSYLNNFFASVAQNPSIDLLFIKFDKHNVGCEQSLVPPSIGHTNIRELCFEYQEYWDLHQEFLCDKKRWDCTHEERETLKEALYKRGQVDWVNSHFRPFRSGVFAKWLNPKTPMWGWCDMDIMLGNFERNFPFDIASQFDVLIPGPPTHHSEILLFHAGHLAVFRHSDRVLNEYMKYPRLKDMRTWLRIGEEEKNLEEDQGWEAHRIRDWISEMAEEAEYSAFTLMNPRLTFLRFPGLSHTSFHVSSPSLGVYGLENPHHLDFSTAPSSSEARGLVRDVLEERKETTTNARGTFQTFSDKGFEYSIKLQHGAFPGWLWFPHRYAVHYAPNYNKSMEAGFWPWRCRRYAMRRAVNGPATERLEPEEPVFLRPVAPGDELVQQARNDQPLLLEFLYNHFQVEKYQRWWRLPEATLEPSDILFVDRENQVQVWNRGGTVTFSARKAQEKDTEGLDVPPSA